MVASYLTLISARLILLQIDVAVNAPEAGTIKEFLANEEDTVTVGQDLVRIELGGAPEGGAKEQASSAPKDAASKEQSTSSDPEPRKKDESSSAPTSEDKKPSPTPQEQPRKESPPKQTESKQSEPKSSSSAPTLGSREERRVSKSDLSRDRVTHSSLPGQNEPHATTNCGTSQAVTEYCSLFDYFQ